MNKIKVIKRYANRKLYDTDTSGYTDLKGILKLIEAGIAVMVIDNVTKQDITNSTILMGLTQKDGIDSGVYTDKILGLVCNG